MFGYCLWYKVNENHKYHRIIKELSDKFKTCIYEPHLTIKSNMSLEEAEKMFLEYQSKPYPYFKMIGNVYQTKLRNFYALQQDFIDVNSKKIFHISLAYKLDNPFSDDDIKYVNKLETPELLIGEFKICIFKCDSIYASEWIKIK